MSDWNETAKEILDRLDLEAEYRALGVDITAKSPGSGGWLACRAFGQDDRNPSAGVNVAGDHPAKGRYKEFNGGCVNLSFFEAAATFNGFADWREARKAYAKKTGVKLPGGQEKRPDGQLAWETWNEKAVRHWCEKHKQGVWHKAVEAAGGRLAYYPKKSKANQVLCLPIYGESGLDADPVNWWMTSVMGRPIPLFQGRDREPRPVKAMVQAGMPSGWMNTWGLSHIEQAELIWKVEGVPDMLALQSAIAQQGKEATRRFIVLTNSNGAGNVLSPSHLTILKGKPVAIVHDRDEAGELGAAKWLSALRAAGADAWTCDLPFELQKNHGKDTRDYFAYVA